MDIIRNVELWKKCNQKIRYEGDGMSIKALARNTKTQDDYNAIAKALFDAIDKEGDKIVLDIYDNNYNYPAVHQYRDYVKNLGKSKEKFILNYMFWEGKR